MQKKEEYFSKELLFCLKVSDYGFDDVEYIRKSISSDFDWNVFLDEALKHRLFIPVVRKILSYKNLLPDKRRTELKNRLTKMSKRVLQINTESIKIQEYFKEKGIETLTLKGSKLTETLYGNPLDRFSHDVDLIIPKKDLQYSIQILKDIGYVIAKPYDNYNDDYLNLLFQRSNQLKFIKSADRSVLELHWKLLSSHFFESSINDNFERFRKYADFSQMNEFNTLFLMIHGAVHNWNRLFWLRDIRYILNHNLVDLEKLQQLTKRINLEKILFLNLSMVDYFYSTDYTNKLNNPIDVKNMQFMSLYLLNNPENERTFSRSIKQLYYKYSIGNSYDYKINFLKSLFFRLEDVKRYDKYQLFLYLILPFTKINNYISIKNAKRKN
jgi:hypothetical protein